MKRRKGIENSDSSPESHGTVGNWLKNYDKEKWPKSIDRKRM